MCGSDQEKVFEKVPRGGSTSLQFGRNFGKTAQFKRDIYIYERSDIWPDRRFCENEKSTSCFCWFSVGGQD